MRVGLGRQATEWNEMGARKEGRMDGRKAKMQERERMQVGGRTAGGSPGPGWQWAIRRDANSDGFFHLRVAAAAASGQSRRQLKESEREREGRAAGWKNAT